MSRLPQGKSRCFKTVIVRGGTVLSESMNTPYRQTLNIYCSTIHSQWTFMMRPYKCIWVTNWCLLDVCGPDWCTAARLPLYGVEYWTKLVRHLTVGQKRWNNFCTRCHHWFMSDSPHAWEFLSSVLHSFSKTHYALSVRYVWVKVTWRRLTSIVPEVHGT